VPSYARKDCKRGSRHTPVPSCRRLKTGDSEWEIPLVGVAKAALKLRPEGFPRYRDKSSSL
jgi:hypothetical protein